MLIFAISGSLVNFGLFTTRVIEYAILPMLIIKGFLKVLFRGIEISEFVEDVLGLAKNFPGTATISSYLQDVYGIYILKRLSLHTF